VIAAHLVCGVWGTIAVALFGDGTLWAAGLGFWQRLGVQLLGITTIGLYSFGVSFGLLWLVNRVIPLRVTAEQERIGLNVSEHGASTATQDLIEGMNEHSLLGDFTQLILVEPETDVAPIALHYNRVLAKMNQIQAELHQSHSQLVTILNSPAFPVVISERDTGLILFINQRAADLFGFMLQEAGRYREIDFWYKTGDRQEFLDQIHRDGQIQSFEARFCQVNQQTFWSLISGLEINYDSRHCILFSFSDISIQIKREKQLHFLAMRDELTGLFNRRALFAEANGAIAKLNDTVDSLAILMIDVDHFKQINDHYGHGQGDIVLAKIAHLCRERIEYTGFVGRLGGEEFAAILIDVSATQAVAIAEELRHEIATTQFKIATAAPITISIGIAMVQNGAISLDIPLHHADQALYKAKANGRNRVEQSPQS
jgi:Amt family ammonium transporter